MGLHIAVGIKWVPNTEQVRFDPVRKTMIREGVESIVNPPDLNAVELALQLRDRYGGSVTVMSMGPPSAKAGLELAVSMGADKGILISDRAFAGADTLATSYVLARAIEMLEDVDLALFGEETIDSSTGHVGPGVSVLLGWPQIAYMTRFISYDPKRRVVRAERRLDEGVELVEAELPAVMTVSVGINIPRPPTLRGKLRARKPGVIEVWDHRYMGFNPECIGLRGSPTIVKEIEIIEPPPRQGEIIDGSDPERAAEWLVEKLRALGVV